MNRQGTLRRAAAAALALAALGVGGRIAATTHQRRMSAIPDLPFQWCNRCHGVRTEDLRWAGSRPRHAAPAGLAVSRDGARLFVALDDRNEVAEVDVAARRVVRTAPVEGGPFGLALDEAGERLYVACRAGDRVAVLAAATLRETASAPVGLGPVAVAPAGGRLVVANAGSDDISILEDRPLREVARLPAGREPYSVAAAPGGLALVANRLAGVARPEAVPASEVTVVDAREARVVGRARLESAHLAEGVAAVPGSSWALVPFVRVRNLLPIVQVAQGWVMSGGVGVLDLERGGVVQLPLDEANAYYADPSGIVVEPSGGRAYVASAGGDVVSVVDLRRMRRWLEAAGEEERLRAIDDLELSPEYVLARVPTARSPRALALSPDGGTLFVAERLADSILVLDTGTLRPAGRVVLGDGGLGDPVRRGERVFARASGTFQGQFSCRSCHPDGHADGLTYDFDVDGVARNVVDNRSLQGLAGTAPFKWDGKNPTVAVQCGPRFAKVLTRADPFPEEDLADLTAFLDSLPPTRTVAAAEPWTQAQERGKAIFFATGTGDGRQIPRGLQCPTCHRPPLYTNRFKTRVGTKGPADATDLFDTPHLLGIGASAPYLHDGRSATLEEIWTVHNPDDLHGVTNHLPQHELHDLIEFLKRL